MATTTVMQHLAEQARYFGAASEVRMQAIVAFVVLGLAYTITRAWWRGRC